MTSARKAGYFVPAESSPHELTFMQWPVSLTSYGDHSYLKDAQKTIAGIANVISEFEPVIMLMDAGYIPSASSLLSQKVKIWDIPTDDLWCRDSGPIFAINDHGDLAISLVQFNGWGNRWPHEKDARIARHVAQKLGLPIFDNGLVGEGGGVEWDGDGTLIAHESSWVNANRNPHPRAIIEQMLLGAYGADTIIWAPGVKGKDVTDDHIDGLARFVYPGQLLVQVPLLGDPNDLWSTSNQKSYEIFSSSVDARGIQLKIDVLPDTFGAGSQTSYANYYICNGGLIASKTGLSDMDEEAAKVLKRHYPDRELIMLDTQILGELGGGIHCATQQMPKAN